MKPANTLSQHETLPLDGARQAGAGCNVVLLAEDATLLELVRRSLDGRQRVWRAENAVHAADLLVAAQSGILFVDAAVTGLQTPDMVDKLHEQFPDLPIVVTGRRDDEVALGQRISSGAVFRFLHKPASAERVRNFIDAAARRAAPRKRSSIRKAHFGAAARAIRLPRVRLSGAVVKRLAGAMLVLAIVMAALWGVSEVVQRRPWQAIHLPDISLPDLPDFTRTSEPKATAEPANPEVARLLEAAGIALSQGHLARPEGRNAIELYRAVLLRDPGNPAARAGLVRTGEELLTEVEQALLAADLPGAAAALDAARSADPNNARLEFFSAQLQHERERVRSDAGRAPLREAAADRSAEAEVKRLLTLSGERMQQGRLTGGTDSAEALILAARALQLDDPGVGQALNALSGRMLLAASTALRSGDAAAAARWLDKADSLGVDARAVARMRAEMESARVASVQEDRSRLLATANQRIAQGQYIEPANDSARHYIDLLRAADPGYAGLAATEALLASSVLEQSRSLARTGQTAEAQRVVRQAEAAGVTSRELSAWRDQLAGLQQRAQAAQETLAESALKRTTHRPAMYPAHARERGIEGWVAVEFTVARDGSTEDIVVTDADPKGVFDDAVVEAVSAWRYQPRIAGGQPVDQRVQARIRFQLSGG